MDLAPKKYRQQRKSPGIKNAQLFICLIERRGLLPQLLNQINYTTYWRIKSGREEPGFKTFRIITIIYARALTNKNIGGK